MTDTPSASVATAQACESAEARARCAAYLRLCGAQQADRAAARLLAGAHERGARDAATALRATIAWHQQGVLRSICPARPSLTVVPREKTVGMTVHRFVDPVEAFFVWVAVTAARMRKGWLRLRRVVFG